MKTFYVRDVDTEKVPAVVLSAAHFNAQSKESLDEIEKSMRAIFPTLCIGHGGHHVYVHPAPNENAYLRIIEVE